MNMRDLYDGLRALSIADDATARVVASSLRALAEQLIAELRMQELDDKAHIERLRAAIGMAVVGLAAVVAGIQPEGGHDEGTNHN